MLHPADLELLLDHLLDLGAVAGLELQHAAHEHMRVALEPRVAVAELEPSRGVRLDADAVHRGDATLDRVVPDVVAVAAGVAVERSAHGPRNPGRELEPGEPFVAAADD